MANMKRAGAPIDVINAAVPALEAKLGAYYSELEVLEEAPNLGPLVNLQGAWTGKGFSILTLPHQQDLNQKFTLMMNATIENTVFTPISGAIPDRGNIQPDIFYLGLTYLQQVSDANTLEGIHVEPGIFLNLPANSVQTIPSVCRMATIPHGDAVLAQGTYFTADGPPTFAIADPTPFYLDNNGNRVNDKSDGYLAPFKNTPPPDGIPNTAIMNPNLLLQNYIDNIAEQGHKVLSTTVFQVNATPKGQIADVPPFSYDPLLPGGINNIPFVEANANATSLSAIFWINTVLAPGNVIYLLLQYSQTVLLDFPVPAPGGGTVDLFWPHIAVANLIKR